MDPLLDLLGQIFGLLDLDEFRTGLLGALRAVVPADWVSLNDLAREPEETAVLIEPPFPAESHATFARYAHENPLLQRYLRTGDARTYRFSDVCTPAELRATGLYREFYATIGLEHQIAFTLPHAPDRVLAVALSRAQRDFRDAERDLLETARPFLIQGYRNAIAHTGLRRELAARVQHPRLPQDHPALAAHGLSRRQAETLSWVATGMSNREIARELVISERTVQKHLQGCYAALGVHSRGEAVALAWSLVGGPAG